MRSGPFIAVGSAAVPPKSFFATPGPKPLRSPRRTDPSIQRERAGANWLAVKGGL